MDEMPDDFSELLKWHLDHGTNEPRKRPKWSRSSFAVRAGYNKDTVTAWLNGTIPKENNLAAIKDTLFGKCVGLDARLDAYRVALDEAWARAQRAAPAQATLLRVLSRGQNARRISDLSKSYDAAEHELIRLAVERVMSKAIRQFNFTRDQSPIIDHADFGFLIEPYLKNQVSVIRALTRTSVTDWSNLKPAAQRVLAAQEKKDVVRVFAISTLAECEAYAASVFPNHAANYGAENVLVCSTENLTRLIDGCPSDERIQEDEDFALYNDEVVAICAGAQKMRFSTQILALTACRTVFASAERYVRDRKHSFGSLQRSGAWQDVFS